VGFKTVQEAIYLRNRVLSRLDVASETADPERRRAALTFVFVGAGFAGVEALGELEDLARDAMRSYPTLDASEMRWILVEAAGRILPELAPDLWPRTPRLGSVNEGSRCCSTRDSDLLRAGRSGCRTGRRSRRTRWSGQRG